MRRLAFLAVAVGAAWGAMVACSSDNTGSTFPDGTDATADASGFDFGDAGLPADATVTCSPTLSTTFAPSFVAPGSPSGQCTTDELGGYFDSCLASGSTDACTTWKAAHAGCTACIQPDAGTGPIALYGGGKYSQINIGGCIALERGTPDDAGACAVAYGSREQCTIASCIQCIEKDGVTNDAITACKTQARTTGCSSYESAVLPACGAAYQQEDGGAYACFPHGGEAQRDWITRLFGVYCGQPE